VLSPCVLPLLPVVLASAAAEHRLAPAALAAGLALSFTAIGLLVATLGFAIGLDDTMFRIIAAILLLAIGLALAFPALQERLTAAAGPFSNWVSGRLGGFKASGVSGQFGTGLLLGAVWSPCVGPTLGAATVLASQGQRLGEVTAVMFAFGLGAALPLLLLGLLSRETMLRLRGKLATAGRRLRFALGLLLIVLGGAVLTGYDKQAEAWLVEISPDWLTRLTTSI
jgi:cytochrome c biogenesis protein CcdA